MFALVHLTTFVLLNKNRVPPIFMRYTRAQQVTQQKFNLVVEVDGFSWFTVHGHAV